VFDLPEMRALLSRYRLLVRLATGDDLAAVEEIVQAAYEKYIERIGRRPVPMDSDYKALVGQQRVWVAEDDGHVVGILVLEEAVDHLLVENVAVAPRAQRRGIGGLLLDHADDRARAAGLTEVRLYTHESMTENRAYYPRRGFQETHRETQDGRTRVFFSKVLVPDPST
jgi:ribosomal protein S18 acetylase RimI-like enzyme